MEKKFIKVSASERLPNNQGMYVVFFKNNKAGKFNFWNEEAFKDSWIEHVKFWFEEVPDRDHEMVRLLEEARSVIARIKRSMLAHPDHTECSEFDDMTTSAQEMENKISEYLN